MSDILNSVINGKPEVLLPFVCVLALLVVWKALDVVGKAISRRKEDDK
ncbi:hypothetical protein [Pinirhizobacter soli]|nr:hypothetical protein [Pinirhizobacter soli]